MIKQKIIFIIVNIIIISLFLLSGCTQQSEVKDSIQTILQKAKNIGDVYYEIIGTTSAKYGNLSYNSTYEMKIWQKMPYMKTETNNEGVKQIIIIRPDGNYMYNNQTQNYTKITSTDNETRQKALQEQANDLLESQTLKVLGSDIIDGKTVTIVQYSYNVSGLTISPKYWIWNEKGIPLKMETKSTFITVNITMTEEYKNFIFAEIPESSFNVSQ